MSKLSFTKEEYTKLARLVSRLIAMRSHMTKKEMGKGNNALIKELSNKVSVMTAESDSYDVFLKRPHLRLIEGMMLEAIDVLRNKVIPEYEKQNPVDKQKYIETARTTADIYASILGKIEEAL